MKAKISIPMNSDPTRRVAVLLITALLASCGGAVGRQDSKLPTVQGSGEKLARPSPQQYAWHEQERIMFVCLDPCSWQGREYDNHSTPLSQIDPAQLDTDQWCQAAKLWGAREILLVAKHTGGFCWWRTETTKYGIKETPWKGGQGDVLAELSASCRRQGLNLGVYVYPGDDTWGAPSGSGGRTKDPSKQEAYNRVFRQQLSEVLTRYGKITEVWFDGSCVIDVNDLLRQHAAEAVIFQGPQATIRWAGTENGRLPYPAWNSLKSQDLKTGVATAAQGNPDGDAWAPLEADTTIYNHNWFWSAENEKKRKGLDELMDIYYQSAGHGGALLLNSTPNTNGLIPAEDLKLYEAFGREIERRFRCPVAEVKDQHGSSLELALTQPTLINHAVVMEDYREGERIREYVLEGLNDGQWQILSQGASVGRKKIDHFPSARVSRVRLRVTRSAAEPIVRSLAVYQVESGSENSRTARESPLASSAPGRQRCGAWTAKNFSDGKAALTLNLSPFIPQPGQYEVRFEQTGGQQPLRISKATLFYENEEVTPGLLTRQASGLSFNINRPGQVTAETSSTLKVELSTADASGCQGVVWIGPKAAEPVLTPGVAESQTGLTTRGSDARLLQFSNSMPTNFQARPLPGQRDFVFTLYGAPAELEPLKQLVQVMRDQSLGNGFDPGPTPNRTTKPIFDYLAGVGWPVMCYPGCADMQIKGGRCVLGPENKAALEAMDRARVFTAVQLGEWGYYFHNLAPNEPWWRDVYGKEFDDFKHLMKPPGLAGYDRRPANRRECYAVLKDYFTSRSRDLLGRVISVTGHSHYEAYAGEWGAACIGLEVGENIAFTQSKFAFARGASRQWQAPWSVQVSPWFSGACTTSGPLRQEGGGARGLEAGHSLSLYERMWLHGWFAGAAMVTPENSIATFFEQASAPWTLTAHGRKAAQVFQFTRTHERGTPFTPVAIVLDHLAGYNGYTDKPWGILEPTAGDREVRDLFDHQLFPGSDHIHAKPDPDNPESSYLRPTPYGEMFDVQLTSASAEMLSSYPVILLAGDIEFNDELVAKLERALAQGSAVLLAPAHEAALGLGFARLRKHPGLEVLQPWVNPATRRPSAISNARLQRLAREALPVEVSGDPIQYQVNRTPSSWVIELVNNAGVAKKPDQPAITDPSAIARVALHPKTRCASVREWRSNRSYDGQDQVRLEVGPGQSAFVELIRP